MSLIKINRWISFEEDTKTLEDFSIESLSNKCPNFIKDIINDLLNYELITIIYIYENESMNNIEIGIKTKVIESYLISKNKYFSLSFSYNYKYRHKVTYNNLLNNLDKTGVPIELHINSFNDLISYLSVTNHFGNIFCQNDLELELEDYE